MKSIKIWVTVVFLILILAAAALAVTLYQNLNSQWQAETTAAQYALNHSPISRIDNHHTFTGDGLQEVFSGKDVFHQQWYAFVWGVNAPNSIAVVAANSVIAKNKIVSAAEKSGIKPNKVSLGYVAQSNNPSLKLSQSVVWEVFGINAKGKQVYEYFDGINGKLVWKYML